MKFNSSASKTFLKIDWKFEMELYFIFYVRIIVEVSDQIYIKIYVL